MNGRTSGAETVAARTPEPWALLVGMAGVAALVMVALSPAPVVTLAVGPVLNAYRGATRDLPARGRILFVTTSNDPTTSSAQQYLAQQALAPRLVALAIGEEVNAGVTGPGAPAEADARMAAAGFRLVRVTAAGVRVYRR
jgi:hypothetical protein